MKFGREVMPYNSFKVVEVQISNFQACPAMVWDWESRHVLLKALKLY
jgi:hypothetical protein